MLTGVRERAERVGPGIIELRRDLHADPEIGMDLPRTQRKVLDALAGLPLEVATGTALSSVIAVLRGGRPGRTVLLRGDMDALPVTERTGLAFSSRTAGAMHACGHDLHVAGLVGAARILAELRADLPGNVIFMFQPGEEGADGARTMIAEGVLDVAGERPVGAYALHVTSAMLSLGVIASRPGPVMAAADTLHVTVKGRGGHGSQPQRAADPVPAACEIVLALQTMVTRKFDAFDPVVVTVGTFHAGTADNVIGDDATFVATVRSFSAAARNLIRAETVRLAQGIAAAHGLGVEARFVDGFPVTVNNPAEFAFAERMTGEVFGAGRFLTMPSPVTGSEDFSRVLNEIPGAYVFLGACPPGADPATAPFNHSPEAVFDDSVLPDGAALLASLAIAKLTESAASQTPG